MRRPPPGDSGGRSALTVSKFWQEKADEKQVNEMILHGEKCVRKIKVGKMTVSGQGGGHGQGGGRGQVGGRRRFLEGLRPWRGVWVLY